MKSEHNDELLIFIMGNLDFDWTRLIFSDELRYSTSNEGPVFVYHTLGTRYGATSDILGLASVDIQTVPSDVFASFCQAAIS